MATTALSNGFISLNDIINNFIISYTGPGKLIPDSKRTEVVFHARRCLQEFAYETLKSQFNQETTVGSYGVDSLSVNAVGSGYVAGTYDTSVTSGGSGTGLRVTITVNSGSITGASVAVAGSGYSVGDTIGLSGGSGSFGSLTVSSLVSPSVQPGKRPVVADSLAVIGVKRSQTPTSTTFQDMSETSDRPPTTNSEYYIDYSVSPNVLEFNSALNGFKLEYTYLSNYLTTSEEAAIPKLAEEALYACMVYAILANRENTNPNLLQRLLIEKIDKLEKSKSRLVFTNFSE